MRKNDLLILLDEFLIELKYNEKSENTIRKYKVNITGFIESLDCDKEVSKEDVILFKKSLVDRNCKTATVNSYIISINKFLKWSGNKDMIVKQIKQQHKSSLTEILSMQDYKRLLRISKRIGMDNLYYIMKILATTGIRIGELKYFTVENIAENYILVNNKGKERYIVVRHDLRRELKKYCKSQKIVSGPIFINPVTKKMVNQSTIWRKMKRVSGIARVKKSKVHAHSFRHLFAKNFLEQYNNNIAELADILGHNSLETTRIYTRSTNEEKLKKLEKLNY